MYRLPHLIRKHVQRPWVAAAIATSTLGGGLVYINFQQYQMHEAERKSAEDLLTTRLSELYQLPETLLQRLRFDRYFLPPTNNSGATSDDPSKHTMMAASPAKSNSQRAALRRFRTLERLDWGATKTSLTSKYKWNKANILGVGTYGSVYMAESKTTHEKVALKLIPKKHTNSVSFQQEMRAMLYMQSKGGHPHLCTLHEHFDTPSEYQVVLDYIGGGELFDHLIVNGSYSELDASRLIREVASALNFLHGIGIVHADLKPENLLLTTSRRGDSVVKVVDFGCAQVLRHADDEYFDPEDCEPIYGAPTPAYCPPESLNKTHPIQPSADLWALGVILFIMVTGAHPYDIEGNATDDQIEQRIKGVSNYKVPWNNSRVTGHLSPSAKELIRQLMHPNPQKRITALQMLQHPWIRGETATTTVMKGMDARLAKVRRFQTKLQAKFFESAVNWSDDSIETSEDAKAESLRSQTSLIERSFQAVDTKAILETVNDQAGGKINMSDFTNLLSDNIKHQHFSAGHVVYKEGDTGKHMYFIDSGTIQVRTKDGSLATRRQGDFFGEGALLHSKGIRSATVTCETPVHALQISREYFDKYISKSDKKLLLTLKEKDKIRKRNRAKEILKLQSNMQAKPIRYRGKYFQEGEKGDALYILESGKVDMQVEGNTVFSALPGNIFGEYSVLSGRVRNCSAKCAEWNGCVAQELSGQDFRKLAGSSPHIRATLRELQIRREFKKAIVKRLKKQFPYQNPQEAFAAVDSKGSGALGKAAVMEIMRDLSPEYTDEEIEETVEAMDLTTTGTVTFDEFEKVFIGDKRTSASM